MYKLAGRNVFIPPQAEIQRSQFGGGRMKSRPRQFRLVQEALDQLADEESLEWSRNKPVIFTVYGMPHLTSYILERRSHEKVLWGRYRFHTSPSTQASPFVVRAPTSVTSLTIELVGSPQSPTLTRVYAGEYAPPLPWQASARNADGGKQASIRFWASHAFARDKTVLQDGLVGSIPRWARENAMS